MYTQTSDEGVRWPRRAGGGPPRGRLLLLIVCGLEEQGGWCPTAGDSRARCRTLGGEKSTSLQQHMAFIFLTLNTCFIKSVSLLYIFLRRRDGFAAEEYGEWGPDEE